jgi:hypothetical protein
MNDRGQLLADHYQKTYELTWDLWRQRNSTFLLLLSVIAGATLLTFSSAATQPLLARWVAKSLEITDRQDILEFIRSFPFGLLQTLLVAVVFYLMVNLYHRALYVLRNYRYLACLEREIRQELAISPQSIAFTREGEFYWTDRIALQGAVKWCYVVMVGLLLFSFLIGRIYQDFMLRATVLAFAELLIAMATGVFFVAYAKSSVSMDGAAGVTHAPAEAQSK